MRRITLCIMLLWRPVSGWLTDTFARQQHWVLLGACLTELLMLIAMLLVVLLGHRFNPWLILCFQMVKQLTETQLYNSIWKILKMRVANRCACTP